jgi:hypothetical protein
MRLKTAVVTAVLAGTLAGPAALNASAASRARSDAATREINAALTRAGVRGQDAAAIRKALTKLESRRADDSAPASDPVGVLESVISEVEFDVSSSNIQAILEDLPGFGPYGSL